MSYKENIGCARFEKQLLTIPKGLTVSQSILDIVGFFDNEANTKLLQLLGSDTDFVYVAESNQTIVGWIHLFLARRLASCDFLEIGGLVVSPDIRGRGLGKALVNHATKKHPGKLRVRCNEKRIESHKFYEVIGFECNKLQPVFEIRS